MIASKFLISTAAAAAIVGAGFAVAQTATPSVNSPSGTQSSQMDANPNRVTTPGTPMGTTTPNSTPMDTRNTPSNTPMDSGNMPNNMRTDSNRTQGTTGAPMNSANSPSGSTGSNTMPTERSARADRN